VAVDDGACLTSHTGTPPDRLDDGFRIPAGAWPGAGGGAAGDTGSGPAICSRLPVRLGASCPALLAWPGRIACTGWTTSTGWWGEKSDYQAVALLHKALSGTVKIGIAKVVIANREYLAAVKPDGLFLVLELMHFASEVLTPEELTRPKTELNDKELKMANALIESMSSEWQPEKYRDEYRDAVMEMIESKAKNKALPAAPAAAPRGTNVVDLVKVLQESINRSQSGRVKRSGNGAGSRRRSTASLVKQKRRAVA